MKTPPTWEEEFEEKFSNHGSDTEWALPISNYYEVKGFIVDLLTSHEATIRQEIGEKVEEILFKGTSGNASHDTAIKELWERMFKPAVLAITNQTL